MFHVVKGQFMNRVTGVKEGTGNCLFVHKFTRKLMHDIFLVKTICINIYL